MSVEAPYPFKTLDRDSLSDRAYHEIRLALIRSQLRSGQKLILRRLAEHLRISATPVREALLRLASEGVLTFDDRGTAIVPHMSRERYLEIRELRVELEGRAACKAIEHVTNADIDELAAIHQTMAEAENLGSVPAALEANGKFHFTLCNLASMPILLQFVENLWVQCGPMMGRLYETAPPRDPTGHQHLRVIAELRKRDGPAVREAISRDIIVGGERFLNILE